MATTTPEHPRLTAREETLIKVAAERQGVNSTEALADHTQFVLNEKQWKLFMEALDGPAKEKPRLQKLLSEPHVAERRP